MQSKQKKIKIICELKHDSILLLPNLGKTPYLAIFFFLSYLLSLREMFCSLPYLFLPAPAAGSSGSNQVTFIRTGRLPKRAAVNTTAKPLLPWVAGAPVLRQSNP